MVKKRDRKWFLDLFVGQKQSGLTASLTIVTKFMLASRKRENVAT